MATDSSPNLINILFTQSTMFMILWFLGIYVVSYVLFGVLMKTDDSHSMVHRMLDVLIFGVLMVYALIVFYNYSQENSSDALKSIKANVEQLLSQQYAVIHAAVFIIVFHILLFLFRIPLTGASSPYFIPIFMGGAWIVLISSLIVLFFQKVLNISLFDTDLWNDLTKSQPSVQVDITGNIIFGGNVVTAKAANYDVYAAQNEVFNVSNNLYTYEDAKAVCTAYGARLATYDEVEEAYNKGGEWCNYGWSQDQLALFPTQKLTWFKLQKNPAHKNDCGRPGINGGYMENPYIRFGVNCYGKKPAATDKDKQEMDANKEINVPKTPEEMALDKKVEFWKENADKLLNINSFNYNQWSEY
jgi:hypothetical protein